MSRIQKKMKKPQKGSKREEYNNCYIYIESINNKQKSSSTDEFSINHKQAKKPNLHNFKLVENLNINKKFIYIADNTSKDFIAPNALNWDTICLVNNGQNIHKQNFDLDDKFMAKNKIYKLSDLI